MAVRRFIARRGAPQRIFSDQGTNFHGARKELIQEIAGINGKLAETFTNSNTQWILNPPAAPHMGGSWERLVRSVKTGLAVLSTSRNPDEETFGTVVAEVEAIVNSRPLTHVPLDSEDDEALTPNHFVMLSSSGVVQPAKLPITSKVSLKTNWGHAQHLLDLFWSRWIREYLPNIRGRTKWFEDSPPIKPGDLVIVVEEGMRNSWARGKVVRIYPGKDGRVRVADVQINGKVLQRPVAKLAVIQVQSCDTAGGTSQQYGSGIVGNDHSVYTGLEATMNSRRDKAVTVTLTGTDDRTTDNDIDKA
ncbi:hypothetical protein RP20_CCG004852 [Aedes albopictus]|nr:hypothetical protein RP20_CCG004852 [Aedes albopictus]